MYTRILAATVALSTLLAVGLASQQPQPSPQSPQMAALIRLFREPLQASWFTPTLLAQAPVSRLQQLVRQLVDANGPAQAVEPADNGRFSVVFQKASVPTQILLDPAGRIDGLFFSAPIPIRQTVEAVIPEFAKLSGRVSVSVVQDGRTRAGYQTDRALAVGSSSKIAVLAAIVDQVASGARHWNDVVSLQPEWKSLPGGVLQAWPADTPLTLATLANQMISISDNTAADALLALAGRQAVETLSPRNRPFLSTRQAFVLKADGNVELLRRYRNADEGNRRQLLKEIDGKPLPFPSQIPRAPTALDVEWFFTTDELCQLMTKVAATPAFRINAGLVDPTAWDQVAFKGGSEPGVLNLTTALIGKSGRHYCVSATWNSEVPVDDNKFASLYGFLIATLE